MSHPAAIVGMATWLPKEVRTNAFWPPEFSARERHGTGDRTFNDIPASEDPRAVEITARHLAQEVLDPFLGAKRRRAAPEGYSAAEAEACAATAALDDAGIPACDVDLILSYAIAPDHMGPITSTRAAHLIGAANARVIDVDVACAAAIPQLEIAMAMVETGRANVVLLTQSHLLLRATPMMHPASPGLGDGASALVVARGSGLALRSSFAMTHGEFWDAVLYRRGRKPDDSDPPWFKAGGDYCLGSMNPAMTKYLMQETVSFGARTVRTAAEKGGVDVAKIDVLASVQPRGFIPGAIAEHLGLPFQMAVTTYDEVAHLGACGPVFNLVRARARGLIGPGAVIALYGQGAGFTRAAAILEVVH